MKRSEQHPALNGGQVNRGSYLDLLVAGVRFELTKSPDYEPGALDRTWLPRTVYNIKLSKNDITLMTNIKDMRKHPVSVSPLRYCPHDPFGMM